MKVEEALAQMRLGKKITNPDLGEDVYLQACRVGFTFKEVPFDDRPISIAKMQGYYLHPDMLPPSQKELIFNKPCKHGFLPQINLFLLMSDDWEVVE